MARETIDINATDGNIWNHKNSSLIHIINGNLCVKSFSLKYIDNIFLIIGFDLIGLPGAYCKKLKNEINRIFRIKPALIVICWTHTHTAPATINFKGRYFVQPEYFDALTKKTIKVIEKSLNDMGKCRTITFSRSSVDLVVNRIETGRLKDINSLASEPGNVLNEFNVVFFNRTDSKKIALINYSCHNIGITKNADHILSGDFAGYTEDYLGSAGIDSMFLQGFSGNLNSKIHGGINISKEIALILSGETVKNVNKGIPIEGNKVYMKTENIVLDTIDGGTITVQIQILQIANILFLFAPGEPFFEIYLNIRKKINKSKRLFLIPVGYSNNGSIGYIPEKRYYKIKEAYYETEGNYYSYRTPALSDTCAERITDGFVKLIGRNKLS